MADVNRIRFYVDYFELIATAGIDSAQSIFSVISTIQSVDTSSFSVVEDAVVSRNNLFSSLKTAYENVFTNAASTQPMEAAFKGLAKHILETSNQSVNEFVFEHGINVKRRYANISNIFDEPISEDNIV